MLLFHVAAIPAPPPAPAFCCKLLEASDAVFFFLVPLGPKMGSAQRTQYTFLMMLAPDFAQDTEALLWLIASISKVLVSAI